MPLYDYKCKSEKCGRITQSVMATWDNKLILCPVCGRAEAERQFPAPGGYSIKGDNSASQKPKHSGSFRRKK